MRTSRRGAEAKPSWADVPRAVKAETERVLGVSITRAARVYGGYAPSATYRMRLADGQGAFFKGVSAASNDFMRDALDTEERVYRELSAAIRPWAPEFLGALRAEDWHALLLEDVGPPDVPPWTARKVGDAARAFAAFHSGTLGTELPEWLPRRELFAQLSTVWDRTAADAAELDAIASLAGARAAEARAWLDDALPVLAERAATVASAPPPHALLYLDARADNLRWNHGRLRIFDWNWATVGPVEVDVAAFAEGIASDGGPAPERFVEEYKGYATLREDALDSAVAALAGMFARGAWRPPPPDLPRIRELGRRQARACLSWAARRFALPEPRWLSAVRD